MRDSHFALTPTSLQTSSACPRVETLHETVSVKKNKESGSVCLCQTGRVLLPTRL